MNVNLFKAELAKNGLSIPEFADRMQVHKSTVYRWLDNPGALSLDDLQRTKKLLGISDADLIAIFFTDEVA